MTAPPKILLPYAGTLPFVFGAVAQMSGKIPSVFSLDPRHVVLLYGLAIVSFIAGAHWGQDLSGARISMNLLVISNVITLAAWFGSFLLPPQHLGLLFFALFVILYVIDRKLQMPADYLTMRRNVTVIVCASLLLVSLA